MHFKMRPIIGIYRYFNSVIHTKKVNVEKRILSANINQLKGLQVGVISDLKNLIFLLIRIEKHFSV